MSGAPAVCVISSAQAECVGRRDAFARPRDAFAPRRDACRDASCVGWLGQDMPMPPLPLRFSPGRLLTERRRLHLERASWVGVGLSAAGLALVGYHLLLASALASTATPPPRP